MKSFAPVATLVYKGLQQPYFEYVSPMWGTWKKLLKNKLERFQSRAATDVPGASYHVLTVDLIKSLSSDTLDARRRYAKSFFMYIIQSVSPTRGNLRWSHWQIE